MFKKEDYIPFLFGLVVLGGILLVPEIWGGIVGLKREDATLPALISCAIFAFALDQKGQFSILRYGIVSLFALGLMTFTSLSGSKDSTPIFIAGGFLGYIVMVLSGWAGIRAARFISAQQKFKFLHPERIDKSNEVAQNLIWPLFILCLTLHIALTRAEAQKKQFYKSLYQSSQKSQANTYRSEVINQPSASTKMIQSKSVPVPETKNIQTRFFRIGGEIFSDNQKDYKEILAQVDANNVHRIVPGNAVLFYLDNNSTDRKTFTGQIMRINPVIDPETKMSNVYLRVIEDNPHLKPGTKVIIEIH